MAQTGGSCRLLLASAAFPAVLGHRFGYRDVMRTMFILYLAVVMGGLAYAIFVGVLTP